MSRCLSYASNANNATPNSGGARSISTTIADISEGAPEAYVACEWVPGECPCAAKADNYPDGQAASEIMPCAAILWRMPKFSSLSHRRLAGPGENSEAKCMH